MSLEQPEYRVIQQQEGIEFRQYQPYLATETQVDDAKGYKSATSEGFKRLFRYISGDNSGQWEISMTIPVEQIRKQEKIAMTAPVESLQTESGYVISFMLPSKYTLATAPRPLDSRLRIVAFPSRTMAVLAYSGRWTQKNFDRYKQELLAALFKQGIEPLGEVRSAFYNSPFTLPFLRRNEVMVEISALPGSGALGEQAAG